MVENSIYKEKVDSWFSKKLTGILDLIICLLLFMSAIYKGTFYKENFLFPNVCLLFLGIIYLSFKIIKELKSKKDVASKSKIKLILDVFVLILPFTYFLPIMFKKSVSIDDSIFELLRYLDFAVIYFIVKDTYNISIYLKAIAVISIIQMVLGIDQITVRFFEKFLNNISTGYLEDVSRLSGTIQYANVTGIVILLGSIVCYQNISNMLEENKRNYLSLFFNVLIYVFSVSCIVLTNSRVAVLTFLTISIIDLILNWKYLSKKTSIYKLILVVFSFITSSVIENAVITKNVLKIYLAITVVSLIYTLFVIYANTLKNIFSKKYVKVALGVASIVLLIYILIVPKSIKLENSKKDGEIIEITKNIYGICEGINTISYNVNTLSNDTKFNIKLKIVNENYGEIVLMDDEYVQNGNNTYSHEIDIPDNTRKVFLDITLNKGKIIVKDLKINGKKKNIEYKLLPNIVIDKIGDTFKGIYGDSLRYEYIKDSISIFKSSPIIGYGGEAFKYMYPSVQKFGYISTEAHSAIFQALVEVGIVGCIVLVTIIITGLVIILKLAKRIKYIDDKDRSCVILVMLMYIACLTVVIFDLAFSFAFMIYIFAVLTALLIKIYMNLIDNINCKKEKRIKLDWSYVRIIVLSMAIVVIMFATYVSINSYRASLIKIDKNMQDLDSSKIQKNISKLNLKLRLDPYDIDYMMDLNSQYEKYLAVLNGVSLKTNIDNDSKDELLKEKEKLIISIKENADRMIDSSYYDKYVLEEVSNVYIENYINFTDIYKDNFSSEEVAYSFYLKYAINLMERVKKLNPFSEKANNMYNNMKEDYIEKLKDDNKYLDSNSVKSIINILEN